MATQDPRRGSPVYRGRFYARVSLRPIQLGKPMSPLAIGILAIAAVGAVLAAYSLYSTRR